MLLAQDSAAFAGVHDCMQIFTSAYSLRYRALTFCPYVLRGSD